MAFFNALSPGFKTDLCAIFTQFEITECLMSCCCPHIVNSLTRTHVDGRECGICDCCCPAGPYHIRQKIRRDNNVDKNALMDCVALYFCGVCSVHQNAKEAGAKFMPTGEECKRL